MYSARGGGKDHALPSPTTVLNEFLAAEQEQGASGRKCNQKKHQLPATDADKNTVQSNGETSVFSAHSFHMSDLIVFEMTHFVAILCS